MQRVYVTKNQAFENVEFFKENSEKSYVECIQSIINSKPFGDNKFYIFSFPKRVDDQSGIKKMYHQPRLTKPHPIPGTTLMRVDPNNPEEATIIWTLPHEESFNLYKHGKIFSDPFVYDCIQKYLKNPNELIKPEKGDLPEEKIREIYKDIKNKKRSIKENKIALSSLRSPNNQPKESI